FIFFFQAEDGIRDDLVTGVQTCALPIYYLLTRRMLSACENQTFDLQWAESWQAGIEAIRQCAHDVCLLDFRIGGGDGLELLKERSEERRVGKECERGGGGDGWKRSSRIT